MCGFRTDLHFADVAERVPTTAPELSPMMLLSPILLLVLGQLPLVLLAPLCASTPFEHPRVFFDTPEPILVSSLGLGIEVSPLDFCSALVPSW